MRLLTFPFQLFWAFVLIGIYGYVHCTCCSVTYGTYMSEVGLYRHQAQSRQQCCLNKCQYNSVYHEHIQQSFLPVKPKVITAFILGIYNVYSITDWHLSDNSCISSKWLSLFASDISNIDLKFYHNIKWQIASKFSSKS